MTLDPLPWRPLLRSMRSPRLLFLVALAGLGACDVRTVPTSIENIDETAYSVETVPGGGTLRLRIPLPPPDASESYPEFAGAETPPGYSAGNWKEQLNLVSVPVWSTSQEYWYGWFWLHLFAIDRGHLPDPRGWRDQGLESLYVAATRDAKGTHDKYTRYFPPELGDRLSHLLAGTEDSYQFGFFVRMAPSDTVVIGSVVAGGPAAIAGLRRDDRLLDIDGLPLHTAMARIDRSRPTRHDLHVFRPSEAQELTLVATTGQVTFPSVWVDTMPGGVGYIHIEQFVSEPGNATDTLFARAVRQMDSLRTWAGDWILDLRQNGGGTIASAQGVAGTLLGASMPLVRLKERDLDPETLRGSSVENILKSPESANLARPAGRIVFLQDTLTASASEILLSSLKETLPADRMISYGTLSYGKGIGQIYVRTPLGGYFAVTTMHIDPLNHPSYHHVGIAPDVLVPIDSILVRALTDILRPSVAARELSHFDTRGLARADRWNLAERSNRSGTAPLRTVDLPGVRGIF